MSEHQGPPSRDLIVVLPGIMGSTLAKDGKLVWSPSAGAVTRAIRTFGASIRELTLDPALGDEDPKDDVTPVGLMPDLHILPGIWSWNVGYDRLLSELRSRLRLAEDDLLAVPYDWRLSNRLNGRRLKEIVEPALERRRARGGEYADAKLAFVCHSMGGLVARWYVEMEGGAQITRRVVTLGTPHRGAVKALGQLVNGVRYGLGPFRLRFTGFARSMPSSYQLLPEYACVEAPGGLRKLTEITVPGLDPAMLADAARFHDELNARPVAQDTRSYPLHPIVGFRQQTVTTARFTGDGVELLETIDGDDEGGDATVPRLSATPRWLAPDSNTVHTIADQHGALQSNGPILDALEGALTARQVIRRAAPGIQLGVVLEDVAVAGDAVPVHATIAGGERVALQARVCDARGRAVATAPLRPQGERLAGVLGPLPPGGYTVVVEGVGATAARVQAVTSALLVWDANEA